MTAYINTITLEYPRHTGDIELDPNGTYEEVIWVDPPAVGPTKCIYEGPPELIDDKWYMKWLERELTAEEIQEIQEIQDYETQLKEQFFNLGTRPPYTTNS